MSGAERQREPLSTRSSGAAGSYHRGVDRMLESRADGLDHLERALAQDPELAVALAARALLEHPRWPERAASSIARAVDAVAGATAWERSHVACLERLVRGGDLAPIHAHLASYPRDALVFDRLHARLFFFGGEGRLGQLEGLVEALGLGERDDWYFTSKLALLWAERGEHSAALDLARRSRALNEDNANAWHAECHALHGLGRHAEVETLLAPRRPGYQGRLRSHLAWHRALVALVAGDLERVRALYEQELQLSDHSAGGHLALADLVGLIWSCRLEGVQTSLEWTPLRRHALGRLEQAPRSFEVLHLALALAALEEREALARLRAHAEARLAGQAGFWAPLWRGLQHLAEADLEAARRELGPLDAGALDAAGGSHLERLVVQLVVAFATKASAAEEPSPPVSIPARGEEHPVLARLAREGAARSA